MYERQIGNSSRRIIKIWMRTMLNALYKWLPEIKVAELNLGLKRKNKEDVNAAFVANKVGNSLFNHNPINEI